MGAPPGFEASTTPPQGVVLDLEAGAGSGWRSKLARRRGEDRLTVSHVELVVEHDSLLQPLRVPAGNIAVAAVDTGAGEGRFAVLRRIGKGVVPQKEGIEGWVWTAPDGSAFTLLGEEAPNVALLFRAPLGEDVVAMSFDEDMRAEAAKRSPLGSPVIYGVLLRVAKPEKARDAFGKLGFEDRVTDREVAPVQRRHLPGDRPANPSIALEVDRAATSVAPPGMG